jgi:hypothetical protein
MQAVGAKSGAVSSLECSLGVAVFCVFCSHYSVPIGLKPNRRA